MDNRFTTPMMKQYLEIKSQYQDCLLFFRAGDFYELFLEDAHIGARVLNITLTSKSAGKSGKIPMAGVPYHAIDGYLSKLVKSGYKVAICEQISEPNKYGIVEREVVRVVTPGTILDEQALHQKDNNYIICLLVKEKELAYSVADVSTGYFATTQMGYDNLEITLKDELSKIHPTECILSNELYNNLELLRILKTSSQLNIFPFGDWEEYGSRPKLFLKKHFGIQTLEGFGITKEIYALETSAVLLGYLHYTQKTNLSHIKKIQLLNNSHHMIMDKSSILNLELFSTIREHDVHGSLLHVLDQTKTSMGGRLLKQWISKPLIHKEEIEERYDAIDEIITSESVGELVKLKLEELNDIERLLSRLSVKIGNARDLVNLKNGLITTLELKEVITHSKSPLLKRISKSIRPHIKKVIDLINQTIIDEPPIDVKSGALIKKGINSHLEELKSKVSKSKDWILELEMLERERTGIGSLKVRFNKVFGFYIEISKSHLSHIPENYFRKQTLVNGERFITPELKKHEEIILTAQETICDIEFKIFEKTLLEVLEYTEAIQNAATAIAILDCLAGFAHLAVKNQYTRPKLLYSGEIRIKNGRHPVVEKLLVDEQFVPNDVTLDNISQSLWIITGPNMAGKSVFIRQVALISLMAQIGCFVPAESAHLSLVDRIFVRSGASDVITSGLSTFMVEMVETAHILNHATEKSLIVMDEIGRGTSTYDGISIAWAVAQYLVSNFRKGYPKVLFATHYHELQALEEKFPSLIKNYHMAVADQQGEPIFLHTILPGGTSHSFGIAVAKLAGMPEEVITNAFKMLEQLEKRGGSPKPFMLNSFQDSIEIPKQVRNDNLILDRLIHKELEQLDISSMTPLQALNKLADLKEKIKVLEKEERIVAD